ncbi:MAG: 1-acyl-sn-glycerol-3-phosphate acyltransferase [Rhodospirillales bacterium]|nr:1-acyl-sn-glycerol-3-phosphate acyltransferase [Rhodospirillales bacterium]
MTTLRSLAFNIWFFGLTAVLLLLSLPTHLMARRWSCLVAKVWMDGLDWGLRVFCGLSFELRGRVDLLSQPGLIASKHQSAWDTMIFHKISPDPAYVMKKEILSIPLYGWLAAKQGNIAVDRKGGAAALKRMVDAASAALARGQQIVIFPQGTRVPPGASTADWPYHPGIAGLYSKLGVPCVPVALNSGVFWGRRSFAKKPGTMVIEVLDPIPPGLARSAFMRELEARIEAASARLEAEAAG